MGEVEYDKAYAMQKKLAALVKQNNPSAFLMLLTHPKTFTFGKRNSVEHLLTSEDKLKADGFKLVQTDRGGLVTYHGPGQLVGYPILNIEKLGLKGVADYVGKLEQTLVLTLEKYSVKANLYCGLRGVFVEKEKIAAIGVHLNRQISTHGFALNVNPDLSHYRHITACGLSDYGVTSLAKLGKSVETAEVAKSLIESFEKVFGVKTVEGNIFELVKKEN